ncbi:hypothetical protein TCAL_12774, partial [Tigriopus californicus]
AFTFLILSKVPAPSLTDTVSFLRAEETSKKDTSALKPRIVAATTKQLPKPKPTFRPSTHSKNTPGKPKSSHTSSCNGCGGKHSISREMECPAWKTVCHNCGTAGHFRSVCRQLPKKAAAIVASSTAALVEVSIFIGERVCGNIKLRPDTGADISLLMRRDVESLLLIPFIEPSLLKVQAVQGSQLAVDGSVNVTFRMGTMQFSEQVLVCPQIYCSYLSLQACRGLGLIAQNLPSPVVAGAEVSLPSWVMDIPKESTSSEQLQAFAARVMEENADIIASDGSLPAMSGDIVGEPMRINLRPDAVPFAIYTARPKGKEHAIPDAFSRSPVDDPTEDDIRLHEDSSALIIATARDCSDLLLTDIRVVASKDPDYQGWIVSLLSGTEPPMSMRKIWNQLSVVDGLIIIFRTALPTTDLPRVLNLTQLDDKREQIHQRQNLWYDSRAHPMRPLTKGEKVIIQNPITKLWNETGFITSVCKSGRSYNIQVDGRKTTRRRNRRYLRPLKAKNSSVPQRRESNLRNQVLDNIPIRQSNRKRKPPKRFSSAL